MATIPFTPEQRNYGAAVKDAYKSVRLDGGASRVRKDVIGSVHEVTAQWLLSGTDYQILRNFIADQIALGAFKMEVNLAIDFQFPALYRALIIPDSFRIVENRGSTYVAAAEFEVEPLRYAIATVSATSSGNVVSGGTPAFNTFLADASPVQIIGLGENNGTDPPVDLDGIYTISGAPTGTSITLSSPSAVNSDWNLLTGYTGSATSAIQNVAIIASPS